MYVLSHIPFHFICIANLGSRQSRFQMVLSGESLVSLPIDHRRSTSGYLQIRKVRLRETKELA